MKPDPQPGLRPLGKLLEHVFLMGRASMNPPLAWSAGDATRLSARCAKESKPYDDLIATLRARLAKFEDIAREAAKMYEDDRILAIENPGRWHNGLFQRLAALAEQNP